MRLSIERILTTHVGSLPRPQDVVDVLFAQDRGESHDASQFEEVIAQGVPPHIGSLTPGFGYERGDPFVDFLPPPVGVNPEGEAEYMRAVVLRFQDSHTETELARMLGIGRKALWVRRRQWGLKRSQSTNA